MTLKLLDRAFETTQSTGTGPLTLQGAQQGFQAFSVAGNGAKVLYQVNDGDSTGVVQNWEIGIGTINVGSPNTLTRSSVLASSNSNAAVNFGAGTKNVIGTIAAKVLATRDEGLFFTEGYGIGGGTANAQIVTLPYTPIGYSDGAPFYFFATVANTGAMTINVNGLGAKAVKISGADVPAGAIQIGTLVSGVYRSSTGFIELLSPNPVQLASQAEAEAGTDALKSMTPVRTKQAIKKLSPLLQYVEATSNAKSSATAIIPSDDTIPQSNEGTEYLTVTITPTVIGSKIVPRIVIPIIGNSSNQVFVGAIFRDAVADAISAGAVTPTNATYQQQFVLDAPAFVTTTLDPVTFKFRYGPGAASTAYINRGSSANFYGNAAVAKFSVTEYA